MFIGPKEEPNLFDYDFRRSCYCKVYHLTEEKALEFIQSMKHSNMYVYECKYFNHFHIARSR